MAAVRGSRGPRASAKCVVEFASVSCVRRSGVSGCRIITMAINTRAPWRGPNGTRTATAPGGAVAPAPGRGGPHVPAHPGWSLSLESGCAANTCSAQNTLERTGSGACSDQASHTDRGTRWRRTETERKRSCQNMDPSRSYVASFAATQPSAVVAGVHHGTRRDSRADVDVRFFSPAPSHSCGHSLRCVLHPLIRVRSAARRPSCAAAG